MIEEGRKGGRKDKVKEGGKKGKETCKKRKAKEVIRVGGKVGRKGA
jgi:hypothetical protein